MKSAPPKRPCAFELEVIGLGTKAVIPASSQALSSRLLKLPRLANASRSDARGVACGHCHSGELSSVVALSLSDDSELLQGAAVRRPGLSVNILYG